MIIKLTDFNGADTVISGSYPSEWQELQQVLVRMPLHLKASDQAGLQGSLIFDPVGTNHYIKNALTSEPLDWGANIPIPAEYAFLGLAVDFVKSGLLVEAQFSNYPFLLNNMLRSELFFKARTKFGGEPVGAVIMITKGYMFPASNSTLYYEQGADQLTSLAKNKVFDVPTRLVGLFENTGAPVIAKVTEYATSRYSRAIVAQVDYECTITAHPKRKRCRLTAKPIHST